MKHTHTQFSNMIYIDGHEHTLVSRDGRVGGGGWCAQAAQQRRRDRRQLLPRREPRTRRARARLRVTLLEA